MLEELRRQERAAAGYPILDLPRPRRRLTTVTVVVLAVMTALMAGLIIREQLDLPIDPIAPLVIAVMVLVSVVAAFIAAATLRFALGPQGTLRVEPDRLVIDHPQLLAAPVALLRDQLLAVWIDDRPRKNFSILGEKRFEIPRAPDVSQPEEVLSGDYLVVGSDVTLPFLGHKIDLPNVALLLSWPVSFERFRFGSRLFFFGLTLSAPGPSEPLHALLLKVESASALEEAVRSWGILRPLTEGEVARSALTPLSTWWWRRSRLAFIVAGISWVAAFGHLLDGLIRDDPKPPPSSPQVACIAPRVPEPVGASPRPSHRDARVLRRLLFTTPPAGMRGSGEEALSPTTVDHRLVNGAALKPFFLRYGYIGGYRREFVGPSAGIWEDVYEFPDPTRAQAFLAKVKREECAIAHEAFDVPTRGRGVRYVLGDKRPVYQVSFRSGRFDFLLGAITIPGQEIEARRALLSAAAEVQQPQSLAAAK